MVCYAWFVVQKSPLGCRVGVYTQGAPELFKNSSIHPIKYYQNRLSCPPFEQLGPERLHIRIEKQPRTKSGADEQELAVPILSLCHGIFTVWSIFSTPLFFWKKGSSGPVTQWRQWVSCDWLWHSRGSLIQSRFHLKINRSMKTPWQEYGCLLYTSPSPRDA